MTLKKLLYEKGLLYDTLEKNAFQNEVFIKMDTTLYPEIKPDTYMISNKGRVYHILEKRFLSVKIHSKNKNDWYYTVNLGNKKYAVHRLMMASFENLGDVELMRKLHIDHKDGDKTNNELYNLRWATPKENTNYAKELNLLNTRKGETHPCATITNEMAHSICKLLESGKYSQSQISEILDIPYDTINNIFLGNSWKWVSKDYSFDKMRKMKYPKCFTLEQIHELCKYFQDNKKDENISIRKYCKQALVHINYDENIITESIINGVRSIYKKERYFDIISKYIW